MTSESASPNPSRSSLLYAMGRLQALNEEQSKKLDALPAAILAQVNPTLIALQTRQGDHEKRLRALERWRWILVGGGGVVLTVATVGPDLMTHFRI